MDSSQLFNAKVLEEISQQLNSEQREMREQGVKNLLETIVSIYNQQADIKLDLAKGLSPEEENHLAYWIGTCTDTNLLQLFFIKKPVLLPFLSTNLSDKIFALSQVSCPICDTPSFTPRRTTPIAVPPVSKQSAVKGKSKRLKEFEKNVQEWIARYRDSLIFKEGEKLCIHIIGKGNRDKDLDNMSKALLDALKKHLFWDDKDIEHLSLMKIKVDDYEGFMTVQIKVSHLNNHERVLFKRTNHRFG